MISDSYMPFSAKNIFGIFYEYFIGDVDGYILLNACEREDAARIIRLNGD